jgi:subtilisin family serine protease
VRGPTPPDRWPEATGAGVLVAVVDSGVNFAHPHLAAVRGRGCRVEWVDGALEVLPGGHRDRYGHGTCVAALIRYLAPGAELLAVRVTGEHGSTDADRLAAGIEAAAEAGAAVICVALATRTRVRGGLDAAVSEAEGCGAVVVAADPSEGAEGGARTGAGEALPAGCPGAVAVGLEDGVDVALRDGRVVAEGRARPAPGLPSNFHGPSLSAARAAAALARLAEVSGERGEALRAGFYNALGLR